MRITGDYPRTHKLKVDGRDVGEWRADGGQTIIAGDHASGGTYSFLVESPPIEVAKHEDIDWSLHTSLSLPSSVLSESSVSSVYGKGEEKEKIARVILATKSAANLETDERLSALYERYVAKKFIPQPGERNGAIIAMIPFLYKATSKATTKQLAMTYYRINADIFKDSEAQHEQEVDAHLSFLLLRKDSWRASATTRKPFTG